MLRLDISSDKSGQADDLLQRIAAALDCPVTNFYQSHPCEASQTAEMLRLWMLIEHEQDRLKVLSILRSAVPTTVTQIAADASKQFA